MPHDAPEAEAFNPPVTSDSSPAQNEAFSSMQDFNSMRSEMTKPTASLGDLELFDSGSATAGTDTAGQNSADASNKNLPNEELQSANGRNKPNPKDNDEPWMNPKERIGKGRPIGQN